MKIKNFVWSFYFATKPEDWSVDIGMYEELNHCQLESIRVIQKLFCEGSHGHAFFATERGFRGQTQRSSRFIFIKYQKNSPLLFLFSSLWADLSDVVLFLMWYMSSDGNHTVRLIISGTRSDHVSPFSFYDPTLTINCPAPENKLFTFVDFKRPRAKLLIHYVR